MSKSYIIAFDQGTTSTRAILFDEQGSIVKVSQKELTQHYPQSGWVEHEPLEIYADQKAAFEQVVAEAGVALDAIKAIGITNQRETTVVWDKTTGEPVYNAIVWLDKRTEPICQGLRERDLERYISKNTGLVIDSYFSATKIKWILDNPLRLRRNRGTVVCGSATAPPIGAGGARLYRRSAARSEEHTSELQSR